MQFSWTTFLLEIINFLVLIWILKRFLYRPILNIIEKRRANIEHSLNTAQDVHAEAKLLQQKYGARLEDWEREKQQLKDALQLELQAERNRLFNQLGAELANEREKAEVIEQRHQAELQQRYQQHAIGQGARFAAKIFQAVVTPELENKLIELLIAELSQFPEDHLSNLRQTCKQPLDKIVISSAFPLQTEQQQRVEQALHTFCAPSIPIEFELDAELIGGLRITLGSWVLGMNLQDELSGFAALAHEPTST